MGAERDEAAQGSPSPIDVLKRVWMTVVDEHACETCQSMDGREIDDLEPPHPDCENENGCRCTVREIPAPGLVLCIGGTQHNQERAWAGGHTLLVNVQSSAGGFQERYVLVFVESEDRWFYICDTSAFAILAERFTDADLVARPSPNPA